ncbi:MAG: LPS export ABC transporter periplasmic protein LptC [Candidatus Elarobacter sp.]
MTNVERTGLLATSLALAFAAALGGGAAAAPVAHLAGAFYNVETTAVQYNLGSGDFTAPAHVTVTRPGLAVAADNAKGNVKAGSAVLRGNVRVRDSGGSQSALGANAGPSTLTCAQLEIDGRADTYHATGRPHYESGERSADADEMLLDRKQKKLHLAGSVTIKEGNQSAQASVVDVDLKTGDVVMHGAPVQLSAPAPAPPPTSAPSAAPSVAPSSPPAPAPAPSATPIPSASPHS